MKIQSNKFISASSIAINDPDLRQAVSSGTNSGFTKRKTAMYSESYQHGETMREQAATIRRHGLNILPKLLEQAEAKMQENGIQVLWAVDAQEARKHVLEIAQKHNVHAIVKSKSMVTEEIDLNHALEDAGIDVLETDLGEYIVQLGEETPSHIVVPVIHKTKASIQQLLSEKVNMPPTEKSEEMANFVREILRPKFLDADMGISGGNFIIAETGSVCLASNEGNIRLVTSMPCVHVALVGIEKVIPTVEDYATLTQVLPRSATGQAMTVYTHLINGPRRQSEIDGPESVYVILVDNGRSDIYASDYCEALACLRCGACLNACPVYHVVGGHAYGWVYPGPIGNVITPLLTGLENAAPLPYASSLCGLCKEVCPVKIDIPRMLLSLRHDAVEKDLGNKIWGIGLWTWAQMMRSEHIYLPLGKVASLGRKLVPKKLPGPLKGWTQYRSSPKFAPKSFHQIWKERLENYDE